MAWLEAFRTLAPLAPAPEAWVPLLGVASACIGTWLRVRYPLWDEGEAAIPMVCVSM